MSAVDELRADVPDDEGKVRAAVLELATRVEQLTDVVSALDTLYQDLVSRPAPIQDVNTAAANLLATLQQRAGDEATAVILITGDAADPA